MRTPAFLLVALALAISSQASAQPSTEPAVQERLEFRDDVAIDVYLSLLAQVAPPARDGAEAYMAAFKSRCGRAMKTVELRRAFADGSGNPTLMAMIRASHQRNASELQRLASEVLCPARS